MSTITINECGVQTILPLGVVCNVTNATSPLTLDGAIYLTITGGSVPYSVTWSNGSNSQNLYSVSAGTYTATVVDAYGDYSATTTCTVETEQFYVDLFGDCANEYNLYLTGLTDTYTEGSVYRMSANTGCFIYSGKTLNGENYLTFDNILEGPFDTCEECDPPIIPPYFPDMLCLYTENPYTTYQFEFNGFANDKPSYTGTSLNSLDYSIEWIPGTVNQWLVLGRTGNVLCNTNDTYNPLGTWSLLGTQQVWTAVSGSCPTTPELVATIAVNNLGCENECKGNAVITASGGISPYQYSFDGGPYSSLPSKTGLCPGNHNYNVLDSNSDTYSGTFTVLKGSTLKTYTISFSYTNYQTINDYGNQVTGRMDYNINVSPALPDGVELTVPIKLSISKQEWAPGKTQVTYTPTFSSGGTSVTPSSTTSTNTIYKFPYDGYGYPWGYTGTTYDVSYNSLVLKKGLNLSGSVLTSITKISDGTPTCSCTSYTFENPTLVTTTYVYKNCTGGTETHTLAGGATRSVCGCSVVSAGSNIVTSDTGGIECGNAITDGNILITPSFGSCSINTDCSYLRVQNPGVLYGSQLYENFARYKLNILGK